MLLRITHHTGYTYSGGAMSSFNEVRMAPRSTLHQQVLHTKVDIVPPAWTLTWTDYWGTSVTSFEVHERHDTLAVTATSTVDVRRTPADGLGLTWEQMRASDVLDDHSEYLAMTTSVRPPRDLAERVSELAEQSESPRACVDAVLALIHDEVRYVPDATGVNTLAADAWQARAGVCQDMANLAIGCLRHVGVPACYVSGYLMPTCDPEVGETYKGESHAWVRWWDGEWVDADPSNGTVPGDRHIEVARGREYNDVPPLRGIFTGSGDSEMFVEVELTRLA